MMHNQTHTTPYRHLEVFYNLTRMVLLIFVAGGLLFVVPAFAQSAEPANTKTGSILGTVVDISDDPVPDATVVLQGPVWQSSHRGNEGRRILCIPPMSRQELSIRLPSLLKDLQSGARPLQSNPGKRKL